MAEIRKLMDIFEILNTKADIKWTLEKGYINKGRFEIDGDIIEILIEEFEATKFNKSVIEFGFSVNGSIQATNDIKNKARLIGSVLNGAIVKIEQINPDVIMIGINKKSGLVESRKSVYTTIMNRLMKRSSYLFHTEWLENSIGLYTLLSKMKLTKDEENAFINQVGVK